MKVTSMDLLRGAGVCVASATGISGEVATQSVTVYTPGVVTVNVGFTTVALLKAEGSESPALFMTVQR
jgi:hypothetical protein